MRKTSCTVKNFKEGMWKISANSNIYILDLEQAIAIDSGDRDYHDEIKDVLPSIIDPSRIRIVIMTHLHYDHIGCFDLFPDAEFYASESAIRDMKESRIMTILNAKIGGMFDVDLKPVESIKEKLKAMGLKILATPGHSRGSICLWHEKEKVLFSGDTLFDKGITGRVDLPTSVPEEMAGSLEKLRKLGYKVLCPGHDY